MRVILAYHLALALCMTVPLYFIGRPKLKCFERLIFSCKIKQYYQISQKAGNHGADRAELGKFISFFLAFHSQSVENRRITPFFRSIMPRDRQSNRTGKCRCVVELGPGTGVITQYLLNSIDPQSRFLAVEIDPVFHENLQKRFPGTAIHRGDAEDLGKWLQPQKSGLADAVVSGLPWTLFTESQCRSILAEIASCMQPDGIFVTLCYWHAQWLPSGLRLKKLLKDYFDAVEMTDTVWTNVPPIFLFRCSGRRLTPKKEKR